MPRTFREMRSGRRWVAAAAGALAVVFPGAVACQWPLLQRAPVVAAANLATSMALLVTAALLAAEPDERRTAAAFGLAGVLWPMLWLGEWNRGLLPLLAGAGMFAYTCVGWGLLNYRRRPAGVERGFLGVLAVYPVGSFLTIVLVSRPEWINPDLAFTYASEYPELASDVWWPGLLANRQAMALLSAFFVVIDVALLLTLVVLLTRRLLTSGGMDRRMLTPVAVSASAVATSLAVGELIQYATQDRQVSDTVLTVDTLGYLAVPIAFLVTAVRTRLAAAAIADRLAAARGLAELVQCLRTLLPDPELDVAYQVPETGAYVDSDGRFVCPVARCGRAEISVTTAEGAAVAVLLVDQAVADRWGPLVRRVARLAALALDNARLQAVTKAQLVEVHASRERLVHAQLTERERLQRDLHDGAQQQLLGVAMRLGVARAVTTDPATALLLDGIRDELHTAIEDLRALSRGLVPAVLDQAGIRGAVGSLADRLPLPVDIAAVTAERLDPTTELTAYFVVCEALTNTTRHAQAGAATVAANLVPHTTPAGGHCHRSLQIMVSDDGVGGAAVTPGGGIAGLIDRVRAVSGELTVHSRRGAGTQVMATIPCV